MRAPRSALAARWARLLLALVCALPLVGCAGFAGGATSSSPSLAPGQAVGSGGSAPVSAPPSDLTPRPLPAFADWRLAYSGKDGRLRAVSLDGKRDSAGSALAFPGFDGTGVWTAGAAPDGKRLAYLSNGKLTIINAATGVQRASPIHVGDSRLWWSPDQRYLALSGAGVVVCVNLADGSSVSVPRAPGALPQLLVSGPYGWLDATHVAVTSLLDSSATDTSLQSLDVTTGALSPIATIQSDPGASFAVAPDGGHTLFWTARFRANPYTPQAAWINNATGAVTPLPGVAGALSSYGFLTLLWRPGSSQALAATMYPGGYGMKYLLLDAAQDTATPLGLPGYPEAWSPDGSALIVATGSQQAITEDSAGFNDTGEVGAGPFTLSAVSIDAHGTVGSDVLLTTQAMTIPMLGFVRTA